MSAMVHPIVGQFRGLPALLDANLLLLYWCARFDRNLVGKFKRLNSFVREDIDLLENTLTFFTELKTTPHVLAEVSNLANSLHQGQKQAWAEHFKSNIAVFCEEWPQARDVVQEEAFWLGLTDAGLCRLAASNVILTIDFPLSNYLESKKLKVINFNHIREAQYE